MMRILAVLAVTVIGAAVLAVVDGFLGVSYASFITGIVHKTAYGFWAAVIVLLSTKR